MGMYRKHLLQQASWRLLLFAAAVLFASSALVAQKTDVNVNLYGAFPSSASGPRTIFTAGPPPVYFPPRSQTADPSLGFRIGVRHIFSPIFGLEMNLGYNRAVQHFKGSPLQTGPVYSHAKPFTIDYVATLPKSFFGVKPFVLAGAGFVSYNISSTSSIPARPEKLPAFEYGIGADYHPAMFPPFMVMRFQYRGLVEHAPDYLLTYLSTSNYINVAEPQVGLAFKF